MSSSVASRRIPKLDPGDADRGQRLDSINTRHLPLGAYELLVCADDTNQVREASEQQLRQNTGKEFYVVNATGRAP